MHEHQDLLIYWQQKTHLKKPQKQNQKTPRAFPFKEKENEGETISWAFTALSCQRLNSCAFLYDHYSVLTLKADSWY